MWGLMCVALPLVKASFLRLLLRRSKSSHATELRELKEECDSFWWDTEDMFGWVCCRCGNSAKSSEMHLYFCRT